MVFYIIEITQNTLKYFIKSLTLWIFIIYWNMSSLFCFFYIDQVYRWLSRETLKTWYKWYLYVYMHTSSKWNSINFIICLRVTKTMLLFSHSDMSNSATPKDCSTPGLPAPHHLTEFGHHPAISSSNALLSFCPQSFPASGTFPISRLFASGDQNTGASALAPVLPMNIQGWFPLKFSGFISLLSKGLSGVFSSTTVWRH